MFLLSQSPMFFDCVSYVLNLNDFWFNFSTVSIYDYVVSKEDPLDSFLVEAFSSKFSISFSCEELCITIEILILPQGYLITGFTQWKSIINVINCLWKSYWSFIKFSMWKMKIDFKKFSAFAKAPTRATPGSASFDLYLSHNVLRHSRSYTIIQTYISFEFLPKYFGKIHPDIAMPNCLLI